MAQKSPEQEKRYQVVKAFKALNTKANRTAIEEDEFSWLENLMPIGPGNLQSVTGPIQITTSGGANVVWSNVCTNLTALNINNTDYIVSFEQSGMAEYFALQTGTFGTIAGTGTFSAANTCAIQWKNERAMILDPANGLYSWDANNVVFIGSVGPFAVTSTGGGFYQTPSITISAPDDPGGVQATAVATISQNAGTLQIVNPVNPGDSYTWVPNVTVSAPQAPGGTQAVVTATLSGGGIVAYNIVASGSGYQTAAITVSGGRAANTSANIATAAAVINLGTLQDVSPVNPGTGYRKPPSVSVFGGGGSNASVAVGLINFATGTIGALVQQGGSGYINPANLSVTITGGSPTNIAKAVAAITGDQIGAIVMTNPGQNYQTTPLIAIAGGGGANATAIAVLSDKANKDLESFAGRIWPAQGRTVFFSAPDTYNDFSSIGSGSLPLTDTTLHSDIQALLTANNFLYVFGSDSINVFSDVQVDASGITTFTNTNVSASIGSTNAFAIIPYYRTVLFQNKYGIFALVGATTTKLSEPLDGIIPRIDFTQTISAGQAILNNILCAVFSFTYNDPVQGARALQAVFFDKKWFLTSQGNNLKSIVNVPYQGVPQVYGTDGISLFQLYGNAAVAVNTTAKTALWPVGDPLRDKQALKVGIEATIGNAASMNVTIDSELASTNVAVFTSAVNANWINNQGQIVSWTNNGGAVIPWTGPAGYQLYRSDAQQYGKYLGVGITSNSDSLIVHTIGIEHEMRARF